MKRPSPPIQVSPAPIPVPAVVAQQGAMIAAVPAIKAASKQPPLAPPRAPPAPFEAVEVDYRSEAYIADCTQPNVQLYIMHEPARLY